MKLGSLIWLLDAVIAAEEDDVLSGHEAGDAVLTVGRCYGWSLSKYGPSSSAEAARGVGGKPETTLVFFLSLFFQKSSGAKLEKEKNAMDAFTRHTFPCCTVGLFYSCILHYNFGVHVDAKC